MLHSNDLMEHHAGTDGSAESHPRLHALQDICWLLLVILVPLWVNLWGQQPFELPKVALMRTLVWLLTALALAEFLLTDRPLRRALAATPLLGPLAVLALTIVMTTLTATNWQLSLWGSYERSQGAVTLLTYLLLTLLATAQLRRPARARRLVTAMVAAGVPIILLSLLQALGWNPFGLVSDARASIYATLGRANFAGAYLTILAPLTLALAMTSRQPRWRRIWFAVLVGEIVVIGLTLARGAWLATALSLALFSLLWWGPRLDRRRRSAAWGGLALLFLCGPLAVLMLGQFHPGSAAARLVIWRATAELIVQRPLLGYGADSLGIVFPQIYPPELVYYQGRQFFVDRAHTLFLDWAIVGGLPGLLAFLLVVTVFVFAVGRALHQTHPPQTRVLLIGVLAATLGNMANNLVSFDVTPTATATWLLMGMGVALATPSARHAGTIMEQPRLWQWALTGLLVAGTGMAIWQMNGRPLLADIAARSAHHHGRAGEWASAVAAAERAVEQWPVESAHHLLLSQAYWQQAVAASPVAHRWLEQAERELQIARQLRPTDPAVWIRTAHFYRAVARQFGVDTRALADDAFRQAARLAPNQATIYAAWGRALLEDGHPQRAAALLRRAVGLDASNGAAYVDLGAADLALGRPDTALASFREAARLLPESDQAYAGMATAYWRLGQRPAALLAAESALQRNPRNMQADQVRRQTDHSP